MGGGSTDTDTAPFDHMAGVFDRLVGQDAVEAELTAAAIAARQRTGGSAMTHSWLFTGPPGSGRSVAALCFAAALQCTDPGTPGCGHCRACSTTMAGTHGDVRRVIPEGLSIGVDEMRAIVQTAARRPSTGNWQVVLIEDADRLSERASNALLKAVEEPPPRTVFLLCAPSTDPEDVSVTIKSRCRHVHLTTPGVAAIARVLAERDGLAPAVAEEAAAISGGHVGRARRLAKDASARDRRREALNLAAAARGASRGYGAGEDLVKAAEADSAALSAELDEKETDDLKTALGAGGTGKGTAAALRGAVGALRDLERKQKSRRTRASRDSLDRALIDLAGLYRDALAVHWHSGVAPTHPDMAADAAALAQRISPEGLLGSLEAILGCREAIDLNVKPRFAVAAMVASLGSAK